MDKYRSSEEIFEQYTEAATALIMDQFATAMQRNMDKPEDTGEIPDELDLRCRSLIKRGVAKQQAKHVSKKLLRFSGVAAMLVVMLFGVVGILFTTVEAVRLPIINYYMEQKSVYMVISGTGSHEAPYRTGEVIENSATDGTDPLAGLLPEEYEAEMHESNTLGNHIFVYRNDAGDSVIYGSDPYYGVLHLDTEDAIVEHIRICSCEAVLIWKGEYRLVWINPEKKKVNCLEASALSREEIIDLAEKIENRQ